MNLTPLPKNWEYLGAVKPDRTHITLAALRRGAGGELTTSSLQEAFKKLLEWMGKNPVVVGVYEATYLIVKNDQEPNGGNYDIRVPYYLSVKREEKKDVRDAANAKRWGTTEANGRIYGTGALVIHDTRHTTPFDNGWCYRCTTYGMKMAKGRILEGQEQMAMFCCRCRRPCETCKLAVQISPYFDYATGKHHEDGSCASCNTLEQCAICESLFKNIPHGKIEIIGFHTNNPVSVCVRCRDNMKCKECKKVYASPNAFQGNRDSKVCIECVSKKNGKYTDPKKKYLKDSEIPPGGLRFPDLSTRPYRLVSIETEMDGDKNTLAGTLFTCGLVKVPYVESYGSEVKSDTPIMCHLKHDGSVSGGELIIPMLDLRKDDHIAGFMEVLNRLKALELDQKIAYNANCGGHIHIDCHGVDFNDIWRLVTIFGYLEDPIYRLAGAGNSYGHRSLVKGYDRAAGGGGYANPIVKGPFGSFNTLVQNVRGQRRMSGLNFTPFVQSLAYCKCGNAGYDRLNLCTCNRGKATIEWRVWNSTGNPRILHAWIAIMQAVHSASIGKGPPSKEWLSNYPALEFNKKKWADSPLNHKGDVKRRITWMLENLVFTEQERDSIMYTIRESDMRFTKETFSRWEKIPVNLGKEPLPKPPNPVYRKKIIQVKPRSTNDMIKVMSENLPRPF